MRTVLLFLFFRRISAAIALIWLILISTFSLFELLRIADNFSFFTATLIIFLKTPLFALETLPFACAIGSTLALRKMMSSNEMITLQTSGLSPITIWRYQMIAAIPFVIAYLLLSEIFLPTGAQLIHKIQSTPKTIENLWLKDNHNYINIEHLASNQTMSSIVIYHTDGSQLLAITEAASGYYRDDHWRLEDIEITQINKQQLSHFKEETALWLLSFTPEALDSFLTKPRDMALWEATITAADIRNSGQINHSLLQTVWKRWMTIPALFLLAAIGILFLNIDRKRHSALPVVTATLIAGLFFVLREISVQLNIIGDTWVALPIPTLLLLLLIGFALKRRV